MDRVLLTENELNSIKCGEALTLVTVMTILVIAIVTVVVFKLYQSNKGNVSLPGGYKFEWN